MASIKTPLLTLAIPTYNRAALLKLSLSKIILAVKGYEEDIEVIISDNFSTDDTYLVVKEAQQLFPFKYFKNKENIGFNHNYIKLIDEYANGTYCWVIGDDDLVYPNAFKQVFGILKRKRNLDCAYVNFDFKREEDILNRHFSQESQYADFVSKGEESSFDLLVSRSGSPGNLMLTFISSVIFKTELLRSIDKSQISRDSWSTFYNLFPHSYFYALALKNKEAFAFESPLITALIHNKSWDSKAKMLYLKFIPEVHQHYIDCGFDKAILRRQEKLIISAGTPYVFLNLFSSWTVFNIKLRFLMKYITDGQFYISIGCILKRKILSIRFRDQTLFKKSI